MKVLITGASSYVGARLYLELQKKFEVIGTYNETKLSDKFIHLDTTDANEVDRIIRDNHPDVIVHAAANANARWCEANPQKAIALNQESTKYIVQGANDVSAKVFLISSYAAIKPVNVYGRTKSESEKIVSETQNGYIILRPSLIIGFSPNTTNDRPFNRILKNLDQKTEAIYDTSWKFQPTYLAHIAQVIEGAIVNNLKNITLPVAVQDLKTRYDIAKDILGPFDVEVKQIDNQDTLEVQEEDVKILGIMSLPEFSYSEIIARIVNEIKERSVYIKI